jgi:hypothetical protein
MRAVMSSDIFLYSPLYLRYTKYEIRYTKYDIRNTISYKSRDVIRYFPIFTPVFTIYEIRYT